MAGWPVACRAAALLGLTQLASAEGGGSAASSGPVRLLPRLCKGCLAEPVEVDYFGGSVGGQPPTVTELTREEFDKAARAGKVLLIRNASAGAAMEGWSCERLGQEFPEAKMRREYDWATNPRDRNLQKMGSTDWVSETTAGEDARERLLQDPDAPPFAPFYWGVREYRKGDIGSKAVIERLRQLIADSVPRFMDQRNGKSLFEQAEFWLGAKGTGARAHMDSHCISTLSIVLSGKRRWRIGPVPRMPKGAGRSADDVVYDDGVAYRLNWKPMYEFTAEEGDAVLFPPGWIHETLNTAEGCTVALTTQFELPAPVGYYRSFYQRLRRVGDLNPCWNNMRRWGSLGSKKVKGLSAVEARSFAEVVHDQRNGSFHGAELDFFDADGDGAVSRGEIADVFAAWAATERAVAKEKKVRIPRPDMSFEVPSKDSAAGDEL